MRTQDLDLYRQLFHSMIANDNADVIDNVDTSHALIILEELINSALESVHIVCSNLSNDIYNQNSIQEAIRNALTRGVNILIFTRTPNFQNHSPALYTNDIVRVTRYPIAFDFCVIDQRRYRLEHDITNRQAWVSANDPATAQKLEQIFERCEADSNVSSNNA